MLSPSIQDSRAKLTDAYGGILAMDAFARSCQSIQIVPIADEPDWLPPVAHEFTLLDAAADAWQLQRPQVWAPVILGFEGFFATFSAVAGPGGPAGAGAADAAKWIEVLSETLLPAANQALAATKAADAQLQDRQNAFSVVLPAMDKSIAAGWAALGSEEAAMQALTQQLGALSQTVLGLGDKLTSDAIVSDKGIAQSAVSLLYAAGAAGVEASIPILGLAVAVLTIGKSFYDLVADDDALAAAMAQINATERKLSDEALAVALTKSTLQTLYAVEEQYLALRDGLPGLVDLWTVQQTKIEDLIDALRSGSDPAHCLDLVTLPQALMAWQDIHTFVDQVNAVDAVTGEPVTLDIATATVRPTLAAR